MPETQSFVSLSTRIAHQPPAPRPSSAAPSIVASVCTLGRLASASSARPSLSLVPSRRTTNGTVGLIWSNASIRPLRDLVAARDAAEDVEQHGGDVLVGEDHLDRLGDRLGREPPPASRKFAGRAAGLGDHVERGHHEPGAVAEDADVAVELDEGQAALAGHPLLLVLGGDVAQRGVVGVAEERVVVERDLRVERRDLAVAGDDQRVDLDEHRLFGDEGVVELGQQRADRAHDVGVDAGLERQPARVEVLEAEQRVDVQAGDRVRVACRRPPRCPCRPAWRA